MAWLGKYRPLDPQRIDVFIPVLSVKGSHKDKLWRIYCEPGTPSANDKGKYPALEQFKPYKQDAETAYCAANAYLPGWAKPRLENIRLHNATADQYWGDSCHLGIAIALLLGACPGGRRRIAATGELDDNACVVPVEGVKEKLELLEKEIQAQALPGLDLVLTPFHSQVKGGPLEAVAAMEVVARLAALGVKVQPVKTLREAATAAGVKLRYQDWLRILVSRHWRWIKRWLIGSALAAALAIAANLAYFLNQPIAMAWQAQNAVFLDAQCRESQRLDLTGQPHPFVPARGKIAWQVQAGTAEETSAWTRVLPALLGFGEYHLAVLLVGKQTGIDDNALWEPEGVRLQPGAVWRYNAELNAAAEEHLLVVMARRRAFDLTSLKDGLTHRYADTPLDFAQIQTFLAAHSDGIVYWVFTSKPGGSFCGSDR